MMKRAILGISLSLALGSMAALEGHTRQLHSNSSASTDDVGSQNVGKALNTLTKRLQGLWSPDCDKPESQMVTPKIQFAVSASGQIIRGPTWVNRQDDLNWRVASDRAIQAVIKGQPYDDLPEALYNRDIAITFDERRACKKMTRKPL